ncbi:MAG: tetratricopeptide repeat protein [Bacteroidales bacterium]|nr:tetratricopeptide repeat protein [Bacteroidales bacterium]
MKKTLSVVMLACILIVGCSGLSKMKSSSKKVRYQANPDPVETMDDKVVVKFTGQVPGKYFNKKCAVFLQPVFSWEGGSIPLEPLTLKGEKVEGDGTIINYKSGGRFTYTDMFDYQPGMERGRVTLTPVGYKSRRTNEDARTADDILRDSKGKEFAPVLISDGVNNTSSWVDIKGNISIAPINYNKTQGVVETADIYFLNGTSELDWNFEMNQKFDALNSLQQLKRIMLEQGLPRQISITGWASPEGEESSNVGVSKNRADIATAELNKLLDEVLTIMARRAKVKPQDVDYYKYQQLKPLVITTRAAGEDWVHFVVMVEGSDIQDKHAIINIVETQQNLTKREQMIRNMAEVYSELREEIFPSLRRAQIALYYSEARKTDAELAKLASTKPERLSFDELMYATYINYNYETKMKYYKWATENHSSEWAAWNNAGAIAFYLEDYDEAERYLNVARDLNPHNPDVLNNTGLLYLARKDYALAKYYFEEAQRQGSSDAEANIPILNLKRGNYTEAEQALKANVCSYNLAFAQLMNEETGTAIRTLDCCLNQNKEVNYLRAIAYARLGDKTNCLKNLKAAIDEDYDYKQKAAADTEFKAYWGDEEFRTITKLYNK